MNRFDREEYVAKHPITGGGLGFSSGLAIGFQFGCRCGGGKQRLWHGTARWCHLKGEERNLVRIKEYNRG